MTDERGPVLPPDFLGDPLACPDCGAGWGKGCSCPENKLAIGRGERAKARREEPDE